MKKTEISRDFHRTTKMERKDVRSSIFPKKNVSKLLNSFYVDNCVTCVNSIDQLNEFIYDAKTAMQLGGFDLQRWEYNGDNSHKNKTAVLGILWYKQLDLLALNTPGIDQFIDEKAIKRSILSIAHRIFNLLGFSCSIVLCPLILLQEKRSFKLSYDEEVNEVIKNKIRNWLLTLKDSNKLQIPRCFLRNISKDDDISIHMFGAYECIQLA